MFEAVAELRVNVVKCQHRPIKKLFTKKGGNKPYHNIFDKSYGFYGRLVGFMEFGSNKIAVYRCSHI